MMMTVQKIVRGDEVAITLNRFILDQKTGNIKPDKLRRVAEVNNILARLEAYEAMNLNPGLIRMNISNLLRGILRRGGKVRIGGTTLQG